MAKTESVATPYALLPIEDIVIQVYLERNTGDPQIFDTAGYEWLSDKANCEFLKRHGLTERALLGYEQNVEKGEAVDQNTFFSPKHQPNNVCALAIAWMLHVGDQQGSIGIMSCMDSHSSGERTVIGQLAGAGDMTWTQFKHSEDLKLAKNYATLCHLLDTKNGNSQYPLLFVPRQNGHNKVMESIVSANYGSLAASTHTHTH